MARAIGRASGILGDMHAMPYRLTALALTAGLAAAILVSPLSAQAQETDLGAFRDWSARSYAEGGATVCNMFSRPTKDEGDYTQRGEILAFITHRPAARSWNVVAFDMGYPAREGDTVTVEIGDARFQLFTRGDLAFSYPEDDANLVTAMRRGSSMIVRGTSARGTATTDTYSLSGFTAAHNAINQACGAPSGT